MEIEELVKKYYETFGEYPYKPIMVSYKLIADLIDEAIISKQPVDPEEVMKRVKDLDEPVDLEQVS